MNSTFILWGVNTSPAVSIVCALIAIACTTVAILLGIKLFQTYSRSEADKTIHQLFCVGLLALFFALASAMWPSQSTWNNIYCAQTYDDPTDREACFYFEPLIINYDVDLNYYNSQVRQGFVKPHDSIARDDR